MQRVSELCGMFWRATIGVYPDCATLFYGDNRRMNTATHVEVLAANALVNFVRAQLAPWVRAEDMDAACTGVLLQALEFSTPGLSQRARAALLEGNDE